MDGVGFCVLPWLGRTKKRHGRLDPTNFSTPHYLTPY